ncbi:hypothetical protein DL96DRAFT_1734473 [Flagelloscypha sp. PMI_526]|nr:hypothetical protein DL96DRAFT_1734473 [Flagelloscypha sp. PMI_526]
MEAYFSNKSNLLKCTIISTASNDVLYTVQTSYGAFKRLKTTLLVDTNPAPGQSPNAGAIHWSDKVIEVHGVRKSVEDCRRREGSILSKKQFWKWPPSEDDEERREYRLLFEKSAWKAFVSEMYTSATFAVPGPPLLFSKPKPGTVNIDKVSLEQDEVFLILVFIYLEVKRQEKGSVTTPA